MNNDFDKNLDFQVNPSDFEFVQRDTKISDKKLETKPTTFIKDAFRRFCKNKSSVVGAIILGILILLAIFVPIISQSNISVVSLEEKFLAPKLFNSGTGFWDGTQEWTGIVYDFEHETPAEFIKRAVTNLKVDSEASYINAVSPYATGGYVAFINENSYVDFEEEDFDFSLYTKDLYFYHATTFNSSDTNKVTIKLLDDVYPETVKSEYEITINYMTKEMDEGQEVEVDHVLVLVPWTDSLTELNIDISAIMLANGIDTMENARLNISLKAANQARASLLIESIQFEATGANKEFLDMMSFEHGNEMVLRSIDESTRKVPDNYWQSTGQKNVYKALVHFCSFTYDAYEAAYGLQDGIIVAKSDLETYIKNGWCEYDYTVGPSSFKVLNEDKCPIVEVTSQELNKINGKLLNVVTVQYHYRQLGYTSMPRFLFGTDAHGYDIVKLAFKGLRTSLILGVCTAAFCFLFGLLWGSISGYFGGNVDLFMERFCDILSAVPWIVIMTLFILHFGRNFFTFFLALCLTGWMGTAGRTRTQFYRFKGREYVLASRTLGASDARLIFRHILPNSLGTIITGAVLMIPSVIFSESTLAYLHLGIDNVDSFGVILSRNQQYIINYPSLIVFPAVIMSLMMISFNLFGNGLRDAVNPSLKGGEM